MSGANKMALLLTGILSPEEIGLPVAHDPRVAKELIEICKEVVATYGPTVAAQGMSPDEQRTIMSTLSGVEYFMRKRAGERVN